MYGLQTSEDNSSVADPWGPAWLVKYFHVLTWSGLGNKECKADLSVSLHQAWLLSREMTD